MSTACLAPNGMSVFNGSGAATKLLVGTKDGLAVLERAGGDWAHAATVLAGMHVSSLLREPLGGALYAGIHNGGVWVSTDDGRTWEERSAGITIGHVYSLVCAAEDGKPVVYAGTEPPAVFRTRDAGRSWDELPGWHDMPGKDKWVFPMPPKIPHAKTMAIDPRDPRVLYVGVEQAGVFKTIDGGRTWFEQAEYSKPEDEAYRDIHQIVLRPNHPDEVYMTTGCGLYRSTNGGDTWTHLTYDRGLAVGYPDRIIFSPLDDRTLYMCGAFSNPGTWISLHAANAKVLVSRDLGETWSDASHGLPDPMTANLEAMSMYVGDGGFSLFAGATDGTVWCSDDGGAGWRRIGAGLGPVSKMQHYRLLLPGAVSSRGQGAAAH